MICRNQLILFISTLLVTGSISCKPAGDASSTKAITGTDSDGKRKAFTLVPIKQEGFSSPMTIASLGLVECEEMDGLPPEITIRTIELLGAVGQLFYNGRDITIPKSMDLRLKSQTTGEANNDTKDNMPVLACKLIVDKIPFNYAEVSSAANQLAATYGRAKSFEDIKDDYMVAQSIFLAMRGATELDEQDRPTSLDGSPLLAQLELMSGTPARDMAIHMASQDSIFNPCTKPSDQKSKILDAGKDKYRFFTCGKKYTAAGKSFRHYEVGGKENAYTYSAIRQALGNKLLEARRSLDNKKGVSLTDADGSSGFSLDEGDTPAAADPAPAPAPAPAPDPGPVAAQVPTQTAPVPALQVMPGVFKNSAANTSYDGLVNNVTGDVFMQTDPKTLINVEQKNNQIVPVGEYKYANQTTDGTRYVDGKTGNQVDINQASNIMQQWDKDGNLKNGNPSPYQFNYTPGTGKAGDNGTFQFMKGNEKIGAAMPAMLSDDKKYVGMRPEDQTKLADLALQEATKSGTVDPKILAQVRTPLETANKVSFNRDKDGTVSDSSFGNVFNVFNEKVATANTQKIAATDSSQPPATAQTPTGPQSADSRVIADRENALKSMTDHNLAMRDNISALKPDPSSGNATVDPTKMKTSMNQLGTQIGSIESELAKIYENENKVGNPSDMNVKDRARSDMVMMKTRELQGTLKELREKQALGVKYSDAMANGSQSGPGGSSYEMAYNASSKLPGELEELQKKAAAQMTSLNNLGKPFMPLSNTEESKSMLANQQGMVQKQIDDLYGRRTRIQEEIRKQRSDAGNFDQVQALEAKLNRVQLDIRDRKQVLGNPDYVPSRI